MEECNALCLAKGLTCAELISENLSKRCLVDNCLYSMCHSMSSHSARAYRRNNILGVFSASSWHTRCVLPLFVACCDLHIVSSSVLSVTCSLTIHVPRDCKILRFNIGSEHVIKSLCLIEYSGERQSVCLHVAFFLRVHTFLL